MDRSCCLKILIDYTVENSIPQLVSASWQYAKYAGSDFDSCVSPTDCLTLKSQSDAPFSVKLNDVLIFENLEGHGTKVKFGCASNGTMKPNSCDAVRVCNRDLQPKAYNRKLFNLITRFSGLDVFYDETSHQREALCWWLNDMDKNVEKLSKNEALIQRYILAVVYFSTNGASWFNSSNWLTPESECNWYGIGYETLPGVINMIDMSSNNIKGSLPSEIGQLRGLERLILNENKLRNQLPLQIVQLNYLQTLNLSKNEIDGILLPEIKHLSELKFLDLSFHTISSTIPSEIGFLHRLEHLDLSNNLFSGEINIDFMGVSKLKVILFNNNLLQGNPAMKDTRSLGENLKRLII